MGRRFVLFLIFLCQTHQTISISAYGTIISAASSLHLCAIKNSLLLFQFQQSFQIDEIASSSCMRSYPKTASWNKSVDCCRWDGVTCDELTGEVIGLDLSCSQLSGSMDSNSPLFQLSHLQSLNLAFNSFYTSSIVSQFAGFRSLMHLNLSSCGFLESVPSEFSSMYNLISLDLSCNDIELEPRIFELMLQNLTHLREVSLIGVNIRSMLPRNLSTSLEVLNLGATNLYGKLPDEIFLLPNLKMLQLYNNQLTGGNSFKVIQNTSSTTLRYVDLSPTDFSGEQLPESIGNFKYLYHLDLSDCNFSGPIPESLGSLTQMTHLMLSENHLSGGLPLSLQNLHQLIVLDFSYNTLGGELLDIFRSFKSLTTLRLGSNLFNGYFPSSIMNLTELESLHLFGNSLIGSLPTEIVGALRNLHSLLLDQNSINGTIPYWVFTLPSLTELDVSENLLTGQIYEFQYHSLKYLVLRSNKLDGPIPKSVSRLLNLTWLDLSYNNFSGNIEVSFFSNLQHLTLLDLSFNTLSLINNRENSTLPPSLENLLLSSCGVKDLDFLKGLQSLDQLDLSKNMLQGRISLAWVQGLSRLNLSYNSLTHIDQLPSLNLAYLDLTSNFLSGPFLVPPIRIRYYFASNNSFTGSIPSSLCNFSFLELLDLSNNHMSGEIPQCLGTNLLVFNLHSNDFQGKIPSNFSLGCKLIGLYLHDNRLEGRIPLSLSNCRGLELLDVGNNHLDGRFPWWLGTLQNLQVLSLRGNHLYGSLNVSESRLSFSALRILDLSNNEFTGILPQRFFIKLKGMERANHIMKRMFNDVESLFESSVFVVMKGMEINIAHVLSIFTTIDLSNNQFQGVIPYAIGDLISLQGPNLSHNKFEGPIPQNFANLTSLESLDLSSNNINGEIPQRLAVLTFLSFLNLSENHLVGRIPQSPQFDSFGNTSFLGNKGLCGSQLSRSCEAHIGLVPATSETPSEDENESKDFINGFTWQAVLLGYGIGIATGLFVGCLILSLGNRNGLRNLWSKNAQDFIRRNGIRGSNGCKRIKHPRNFAFGTTGWRCINLGGKKGLPYAANGGSCLPLDLIASLSKIVNVEVFVTQTMK
ncbi:OLC1v1030548C1 [Oldenlandia corymbosa var. corymbosa]|uniref:OLC1v1030548C1 n=1 Tax=Oldenlandia corymbosa var. corymbosa TaxID=529605 RepID=A0AAV1CJX3_OLDCO|nr:OLC1v1030548C1 [Oldenlandia corymbosa var. corymbosa]